MNKAVSDNPALVNTAPFADGWFLEVKLSNPRELDQLLTPDAYRVQIGA